MANQKPERQFNYLKILKDSKNALNWFIDYSAKLEFHDFGGTMSFDLITVFLGYFFPIHKDGTPDFFNLFSARLKSEI